MGRWFKALSLLLLLALILAAGCTPQPTGKTALTVFHAGSLSVPFKKLAKDFEALHPGAKVLCEAAASGIAIRKVTELRKKADLVASADYSLLLDLMFPKYADWHICFAGNSMVIAYTKKSKFAQEIIPDNWYDILTREGIEYGHSSLYDPCGYRTLLVWQLAERYYKKPGLYQELIRGCPQKNIRPKSTDLIPLLQTGELDYAFEYRSVAMQHGLRFVELPEEINLSSLEFADLYRQARIEVPGKKPRMPLIKEGKPIVYGITIPRNAPCPDLAVEFLKFLLGEKGQAIMEENGQPPIVPGVASDLSEVPPGLRPLLRKES